MRYLLLTCLLLAPFSFAIAETQDTDRDDNPDIYNTAVAKPQSSKMGMTFGVRKQWKKNNIYGQSTITTVGCKDGKGVECDAYKGDTACSVKLPVLCFAPLPNQNDPSNGDLHQWANGRMKTVGPYSGNSFNSLSDVNAACAALGNPNWRVAEFHENPKGWNWTAYGYPKKNKRFWVHIKDKPANCW